MQVVVTTHSPYFLDMVPLESIIVTEKNTQGSIYKIPNNEEALKTGKINSVLANYIQWVN